MYIKVSAQSNHLHEFELPWTAKPADEVLNGEEVDCEDVNDLNAVEQQRILHLAFSPKSFELLSFVRHRDEDEEQSYLA